MKIGSKLAGLLAFSVFVIYMIQPLTDEAVRVQIIENRHIWVFLGDWMNVIMIVILVLGLTIFFAQVFKYR